MISFFSMESKSLVSVIITTRNEAENIGRLLESIKKQTYPSIEIIVVDNNSTDATKSIARKYTNRVFDKGPERSAQRNFGARKARGEYLLFLDADMELSPKVVEECVSVVSGNDGIAAATILEEPVARNFWEKTKAFERSFYNLEGDELTDAARFFRRDVFEKAGGYDESITGPEDWDLPENVKKQGYKIGRVKAKIYHYERIPNLYSLARKKFYYGLKAHRYLRKQKISPMGPKTIYFLRPVFYKNWRIIIRNPLLSLSLFYMLFVELLAGGFGYALGRLKYD